MHSHPAVRERLFLERVFLLLDARSLTSGLQTAIDILVLIFAFEFAYLLRFDFEFGDQPFKDMLHQGCYVVVLQAVALQMTGVSSFIWRYIGLMEIKTFLKAALISSLPALALRLWLPETFQTWRVPFSIIVIDTGLAFGGVLAVRVLRRALYEHDDARQRTDAPSQSRGRKRTLLIGAGRVGMMAAREIRNHSSHELEIKGFVDDDRNLHKSMAQGVPVMGTTADLPRLVAEHDIDLVIISIAEVSRREVKRITSICDAVPVPVKIVPAMSELLEGKVNFSRIRDLQIEDLLGRAPVHLDQEEIQRLVTDRAVLVSGAGGSIGSELTRQIARFKPSVILLVERAEFALFNIERELREAWPDLSIVPLIADVGDEPRMRSIFATYAPAMVLHAAAHKHVPMMESNPTEAVKNNILATRTLARLAGEAKVGVFVMISTDKAVRPRSVMGASKRMAELVVQSLNGHYDTRFLVVRFGNVIGSAGSVIPLFREQIGKGGPVTVTHPDMLRYFMTIPEASQLVLQAAAIGEGSEIFILDMGEPVKILDLAKDTIRLSGFKPNEDIDIVFTGLRPGEKLFEELETKGENISKTKHPKIFIGRIAPSTREKVDEDLEQLSVLAQHERHDQIRVLLNAILPEAQVSTDAEAHSARRLQTA
ncbi:MAG: nucleoside-diphosphate sugar epimerase/dehydratase [Acidobacteriota bacterium]